jgi:hypothetical protein
LGGCMMAELYSAGLGFVVGIGVIIAIFTVTGK